MAIFYQIIAGFFMLCLIGLVGFLVVTVIRGLWQIFWRG